MSGMYTSGLIGLTEENVGIDRRFYTNSTDTNPTRAVSYNNGRVDVYLNGVKLVGNHAGNSNHDYTMDNVTGTGTSITLVTDVALVDSDVLELVGYVSNSSNTVQTYNFNVTGNTTQFTASHTASSLVNVYLNGVLLDSSDYTLNGSDTVTLNSNAVNGDVVAIQVIGALDYSDFVSATDGGTFSGNVAVNGDLTVDTNTLKVDSSGNKVGIGEASPQDALHIVESSTRQLRLEGSAPSQYFKETDTTNQNFQLRLDSGKFLVQTNNDAFDSASTKVAIDQSGNVGIGEQTAPLAKLDIKGNTDTFDGMAKIYLTDNNSNSASRNWSLGNGGSGHGNLTFAVSASKDGNAGDDTATNAMVITSDGYVTKPKIPIFSAYLSTVQANIVSGGWRTIQFDTLDYACSHYNTSNYTFTTPIAGKYQFNLCIRIDQIDTGIDYLQLNTNIGGTLYYGPIIDPNFASNPSYWYMSHSQVFNIGASTAVKAEIYTGGTPNVADIIASNVQSRWSGFLIG